MDFGEWKETDFEDCEDVKDEVTEKNLEEAFTYRATQLDQLVTLDEFGMERTIQEMMEFNEMEENDG